MAQYTSRLAVVSHWVATHKDNLLGDDCNSPHLGPEMTNGDFSSGDNPEEAKTFLQDIIKRVEGLYAIVITDRDGIPIIKVATAQTPEAVTKPSFLASVSLSVEQAGKLGTGKNRRILCMFNSYQVIHFNKNPLMISLIASGSANTGLLLNLDKELNNLTEDIKAAIDVISD